MGAWGIGVFDNDDAVDWVSKLANADSSDVLSGAIDAVTNADEYLETPEGSRLLCACEVIAALNGQPSTNLPDEVRQWVKSHEMLDIAVLIPVALQAIDRVLGEDSELNQLWRESENEYPMWRETVLSIKGRLRPLAP
jgi:hypothetical protein